MGLNPRQVEILQWITDGTPERGWPDWTHRATAKALQARGLVKVRGRGSAWTAVITDLGNRVLAGEEPLPHRPSKGTSGRGTRATRPTPGRNSKPFVDPVELIRELALEPRQTLRIREPDPSTRAGYRRALAAIPADLVPAGKRVTHKGRDSGDLVMRLVDRPDPAPPEPEVPIPEVAAPDDPLIKWLTRNPEHLDVAEASRDRALRIIQGVTATLSARGNKVAPPRTPPEPSQPQGHLVPGVGIASATEPDMVTFEVTIGDQVIAIELYEEKEKIRTVLAEDAAKLKYEWQRAAPVESWEFNGRLALNIRGYAPSQGWADRKRWSLESRLSRFVRNLEEAAEARVEERRRAEEEKLQRRREWDEALPKARAAYLEELNRARLDKQLTSFGKAEQLRAYADAVTQQAAALTLDERAAAEAWAEWIHRKADRCDPTLTEDALVFVEPSEIPAWELDKYMPRGLRASHPPA